MLYSQSTNKTFIYVYQILIEVFIGFAAFVLFFGVFANYIYIKYFMYEFKKNLLKAISFYEINTKNTELSLPNLSNQVIEFISDKEKVNIDEKTKKIINNFIGLIIGVIIVFLILIFIPIIIGLVPFNAIDFKFIIINFLIHIVAIVVFETILLLFVLPYFNIVSIEDSINTAKTYTANANLILKNTNITNIPNIPNIPKIPGFP